VELENGHIKVDEFQNTTASGVYALGDVAGKALLTPGMLNKCYISRIYSFILRAVLHLFSRFICHRWWFPKSFK